MVSPQAIHYDADFRFSLYQNHCSQTSGSFKHETKLAKRNVKRNVTYKRPAIQKIAFRVCHVGLADTDVWVALEESYVFRAVHSLVV